ncbi:VCBS repeat-containing protein [Sphaerisporangium album]|uniref:VCBS repeat-containing protein n=1 Tax=Sphaerisporangium album TaxID=509200 RepID=A0A367FD89_9ACTN|nr:VCBS repeat-containing protein [Sphaerisporangium album]RCG27879.1 VCBS repeat-containing protein [Sphaerisporangium album]
MSTELAPMLAYAACVPGGETGTDAAIAGQVRPQMNGPRLGQSVNAYNVSCARIIVDTTKSRSLDKRAAVIAVTTAITESTLHNYTVAVDHDSLGLFQQRPSQGWGTPAQLTDPVYSTNAFLNAMLRKFPNNGWMSGDIGTICQTVQVSAVPDAYGREVHDAQLLVDALWTAEPPSAPPADSSGMRADYNGDGLDDVAAFYDYPGLRTVLFVWTAKAGGGFTGPANVWDSGPGGWDQTRSKPVNGDFNGDGRADVGVFYNYPDLRTVLFVWTAKAGGGFTGPANVWDSGAGGWDQTRSKPVSGDFNGDGRGDVGVFYDYPGLRTVLFVWSAKTGGGFTGPANVWDSGAGGWDQTRSKPVNGDFNGDGMTDVGVFYNYPDLRTVLFVWTAKTGGGFTGPANVWDSGAGGWDQTRSKPVNGDFNGDGRADVGVYYDYPGLRTVLFVWSAKTGGGFTGPANVWDSGAGGWDQTRSKPVNGDFNGDGMTDVGVFYNYPDLRTVLFVWTAKATGGFTGPANVWDSGPGGWDQTRTNPL